MPQLNLTFFGSPLISIDGKPINHRVDKGIALLALLAFQGPKLHRDIICANLWTGSEALKARGALRTALWRLKEAHLSPWLESKHEYITLQKNGDVWVDVQEFQDILEKSKQPPHHPTCTCQECSPLLEQAVALYRGDFLADYSPRNAAGFDDWRSQIGQNFRNDYLYALERLANSYHKQGQFTNAMQAARLWLAIDPYNEAAHILIIRCLAHCDQRSAAIAHFRAYKRLTRKKLDFLPGSEITTLYKQILTGRNPPSPEIKSLPAPAILLLDIDHITELRTRYGSLMENVFARFSILVNDCLQQYGGRIIKQSNDGFTIYFDQSQPLRYAIALHRHAFQTIWGLPEPLLIRMVITATSNEQYSHPKYYPELQICRQLLQSASGGQVLLTESALRNLELPNTSRTHHLGSFLLPGRPNPTQVYQLVHPHLPAPEPNPLGILVRSPTSLPVQFTRFVGREAELKQIAGLLDQSNRRLITLVGPGGVGKTRLGIQVIRELHPTPPDGIFYIPLVAHQDPATLYQPIADALNLSFNNNSDQASQLIDHLRARRMLLLLDNFEHLLAGKSFLLELLASAPGLHILLTSRERLNLPQETLIEVPGLPYPIDPNDPEFEQYSGIRLFIQNAQRVSPKFTLRAEDKPHLIQICTQISGLPLGIELSSAWIRTFSCQEIARSIQQNLDFVQSNSPDIPTRHRSLRAAFDHSWRLLSEEDRRTISKLAIYRNGFSIQAADRLANANPTMITSYVDKNILTRVSEDRFLMLETLRAYALEYLKADLQDYENLLDNHSGYYLNFLVERFGSIAGESGAVVIQEIWQDIDNIRDAINRAIERKNWLLLTDAAGPLMAAYEMQGRIREGSDHTIAIMKQISEHSEEQQELYYLLLGWYGNFSFRLGFSPEAIEKMKASIEFARSQGNLVLAANFLMLLADAHRRHGDLNTAMQEITQSVEMLAPTSAVGNALLSAFYANALTILGVIQLRLGQLDAARQTLSRCRVVIEKSRAYYTRIRSLDLEARIAVRDKRYQESLELRLEALAIAEEFNDRRNIAIMLNNLGDSAENLWDKQRTFAYIAKAQQISSEIGDRQLIALTCNNLGMLSLENNQLSESIQYYHKSLDMYRRISNTLGTFLTLRDASRAYLAAHDPVFARSLIIEALQLGSTLGEPHYVIHLLSVTAQLLVQMGRAERAAQLCALAIDHPDTGAYSRNEAKALLAEITPQTTVMVDDPPPSNFELPTFDSLLAEL